MAAVTQTQSITEDDLLAFQFSHFDDDTKPEQWFVDANTALNTGHTNENEPGAEDRFGYYTDGTKRTLTDEQIALFRHSEVQRLLRERRLQCDEVAYQEREAEKQRDYEDGWDEEDYEDGYCEGDYDDDGYYEEDCYDHESAPLQGYSSDSSLEGDLVGLARQSEKELTPQPPSKTTTKREEHMVIKQLAIPPSQSSRSDSSHSSEPGRRQRTKEVPYKQRHKRKWEDYIDANDPIHGSITHRRMVRELDQHTEVPSVEVDYGEETVVASPNSHANVQPTKRTLVSYEEE
ncbi:hypothetical protein LTR62_004216 [Meristemomyces frigidus]|uniref:Uncharacterized protein n=1 Tax=Meristemomyces frigidus TaxID=1508187 RepID=A0AAN7TI22_9PEZI|nr:hypothetical protein LTR62_004216 [Meristemomyces frigidus]